MIVLSLDDTNMRGPLKGLTDSFNFDESTPLDEAEKAIREAFESTIKCWRDNREGRSKFVQEYEEG